jgi:hypothetical protein
MKHDIQLTCFICYSIVNKKLSCCESKELENCGFCKTFPCETLNQFAFDKEQGDDGARLKQCECWCKEAGI